MNNLNRINPPMPPRLGPWITRYGWAAIFGSAAALFGALAYFVGR